MQFKPYVHSVVADASPAAWPVQGQGLNECSFTSLANGCNLLEGAPRYTKDEFIREVGPLFQASMGGTLPPIKAIQLRRRGYGSHFGNLAHTDGERVLHGLIDMGVPVIVDIYPTLVFGPLRFYGQHATVLAGYSDPYTDANGVQREEYYLVDAQWPALGTFDLASNDTDRDGDGSAEPYPGNRTLSRFDFLQLWSSRNYCPIFRSQVAHDAWYDQTIQRDPGLPLIGWLGQEALFGSDDRLRGAR